MKTAIIYGPRDIRVEEAETPIVGPDDVLVQVRACGICGSDVHRYLGTDYGRYSTYPMNSGHEYCGDVVEVGSAVAKFRAGDKVTLGISWVFFEAAQFSGFASEEAFILPFLAETLDVRGLLLGGTIIAALGALDDVTVTQAATVLELRARNSELSTKQLTVSGLKVGREHIASTVNTLLLAYAGSSIPLLLLFAVSDQSLGAVANSELIGVEIVRTLCGSIGLVAALPLTTSLAALLVRPQSRSSKT